MFLLQGCGSNNPSTTSAGGTTGTTPTGGTISTGGAAPTTGGTISTGGAAPTTGGTISTGGAAPTTGGTISTGGAAPTTGGIIATGGAAPATGGTISTGGAAPATGGTVATDGAAPATGGIIATDGAAPATGGTVDAGGTTSTDDGGTSAFQPLCATLVTAAGSSPTKGGICAAADPQLCYKTCGPKSVGFKSETCTGGSYVEQTGCSFPPGDYSCYKIPTTIDATCPTTAAPQASTACSVADCVPCNLNGNYLDSSSATKQGYCVCPATSAGTPGKWTCASTAAWPCPQSQGC